MTSNQVATIVDLMRQITIVQRDLDQTDSDVSIDSISVFVDGDLVGSLYRDDGAFHFNTDLSNQ